MSMKSFSDRNPIVVGLVSVAVLSVALTASFLVGTLGLLESRYTMTGIFTDTGGLRSGNDVELAGVDVGKVTNVRPEFDKGRVVVTWEVDRDVELGPATRAEVRMSNILGGRYLRLSGPVTKPYMGDVTETRRQIPKDRTSTPTTFNDLLNSGAGTLEKLDRKAVASVLSQLQDVSSKRRGNLGSALTNLTTLADTVNGSDVQIQQVLADGNKLLSLVNDKDAELSRLARNATQLLEQLRARQAELSVLLGDGDRAVQNVSRLITQQQKALTGIIDDLGTTMKTLEPQIADINSMLTWAGPTLTGFAGASSRGPFIDAVFSQLGPLSRNDVHELAKQLRATGAQP